MILQVMPRMTSAELKAELDAMDRGFEKLEVALAQGKKAFDKRETIKERDNKRELDRVKKIKL